MIENKFKNADEAFDFYYGTIPYEGKNFGNTKAMFNQGFTILNPADRIITNEARSFNVEYAEAEWQWYLSGDPSTAKLGEIYGKIPKIWQDMSDGNGRVNSNYGYQWERGYQLDKVVAMLKENPDTRQACVSIYDGKEITRYRYDTPCTYAIQFTVVDNKLDMCVTIVLTIFGSVSVMININSANCKRWSQREQDITLVCIIILHTTYTSMMISYLKKIH